MLDMDLTGGFSYDGIAHTFSGKDWDFVGSYGLTQSLGRNLDEPAFAITTSGRSGQHAERRRDNWSTTANSSSGAATRCFRSNRASEGWAFIAWLV